MTQHSATASGSAKPMQHVWEQYEPALHQLIRSSPRDQAPYEAAIEDAAIAEFYEAAIRAATRFCRLLHFRPYAERGIEAVHEWFCQLRPHRAKGYRQDLPLFPYAYTSLFYVTLHMAKKEARRATRPLLDDALERPAKLDHMADLLDLDEALFKLPPDLLKTVSLRFHTGLSGNDAAQALGISRSGVNGRIHRAVKILRRSMLDIGAQSRGDVV
jgi:DNA-directed RNA polymerase specialized sigma24 family protein